MFFKYLFFIKVIIHNNDFLCFTVINFLVYNYLSDLLRTNQSFLYIREKTHNNSILSLI